MYIDNKLNNNIHNLVDEKLSKIERIKKVKDITDKFNQKLAEENYKNNQIEFLKIAKFKPDDIILAKYHNCTYLRPLIIEEIECAELDNLNTAYVCYYCVAESGNKVRIDTIEYKSGFVKDKYSEELIYTVEDIE